MGSEMCIRDSITLSEKLRQEHVYEITVAGKVGELFPATGHYTMKRIPTN